MFFFFKQKTAYEMRISDWSSDVCSSDLCQGLIEILPDLLVMVDRCSVLAFAGLRHQQLPILLDIGPVLDRLEDRPEVGVEVRQSLILGADVGIEFVNVVEIEAALRAFSEVLIFRERGIQRLQDSSIVDEQTVLLLLMQPVHTGDGLDQIMLFELLVDVKDSIARLFRIAARGSVSFAMFLIWRKWSSENSSSRHCAQNFRGVLVVP